jgi:chromosome segregation ATPase
MNARGIGEMTAIKLAELSHELEELEKGRVALLSRVESLRASLLETGQRTAGMRASVNLLCEHVTNVVAAIEELRAIEAEIKDLGGGLEGSDKETSALIFETESLQQGLDEADDDLERLSAIIIEGKARHPRGH